METKSRHQTSLGFCMYCGSFENLSDEHIVPFGMGGDLLFRRSSCGTCAAKTSLDELKVLRGFMYEGRLVGKFPSRRKNKQPKTLKRILLRDDGTEFTKELLIRNGVSVMHLPIFNEPGIIGGDFPDNGINIREMGTLHLGSENYSNILGNDGVSGFGFKSNMDISPFCRVLSKIAYGYHVMQEGTFPQEESPALSIMLNLEQQFGMWIGSKDIVFPKSKSKAMHLMQLYKLNHKEGGAAYMVAINLFNNWGVNSSYLVTTRLRSNA